MSPVEITTAPLLLFGYALISNVAIAVVPHEPVVALYGKTLGVLSTAIIATLGTVLASWIDRVLLLPLLPQRLKKAPAGLLKTALNHFERWPFLILALSGLTPLPFWPFKLFAHLSDYPVGRYLAAIAVGRLPRYLLIAALGSALSGPAWIGAAGLFVVWALLSQWSQSPKKGNSNE